MARLWKLKGEVKQNFAVGNILTYVCSIAYFVYCMFSTIFYTMVSILDYSRGGIENRFVKLKLWAIRKSPCEAI